MPRASSFATDKTLAGRRLVFGPVANSRFLSSGVQSLRGDNRDSSFKLLPTSIFKFFLRLSFSLSEGFFGQVRASKVQFRVKHSEEFEFCLVKAVSKYSETSKMTASKVTVGIY